MKLVGKILKWLLIILGSLVGIVVLTVALILLASQIMLIRDPEWHYYKGEDKTISIMAYKGQEEVVVVPETLRDCPVTRMTATLCDCETVREIYLPATLTETSSYTYSGCRNLQAIHVAGGNLTYKSVDGLLLSADGKTLHTIPWGLSHCAVPEGVEILHAYAAWFSPNLETLVLPEGLTTLDAGCLSSCVMLREVNIPASVTSIGDDAFQHSTLVTLTVVPGSYGESYAIQNGIPYRTAE